MNLRIVCVENGIVYYQESENGKFLPLKTVDITKPNQSTPYIMHDIDTFLECFQRWNAYVTNPTKLKAYMRPAISYVDAPYRMSYEEFITINNRNK